AEMNHKEPGFELEDSKMGQNRLLAFVRLDFKLWGFKAWILFLVSALGTPWDLLDQRFAAIYGRMDLGGQGNLVAKLGQVWGDVERLGTELEELWMRMIAIGRSRKLVNFSYASYIAYRDIGNSDIWKQKFLVSTVSSLMAYFVAILTSDSTRSCVMQCTLLTEGMRSIISTVSISLEGFLPSILLLVVIIVAVVIVTVIRVVVVVAIVGVVIIVVIIGVFVIVTIIRVVVVVIVGVSFILKLSFMIISFLHRIALWYLIH
ncbi:hypothetical protein Tco_1181773, partial [Tanacetum coccineum]